MIPLTERSPSTRVNSDNELRQREINLRVAAPGIIQSFNSAEQTVTVQLSIREKRNNDGVETWEDIPQLVDVPVVFPRAGGYILTMPIKPGDECLVIFRRLLYPGTMVAAADYSELQHFIGAASYRERFFLH